MMSRGTSHRSAAPLRLQRAAAARWVLNSDALGGEGRGGAATAHLNSLQVGNAVINTDCPSLTPGRSVSLMIWGAPPTPVSLSSRRKRLINVWSVAVVFPY
jgi:hypothetical protein